MSRFPVGLLTCVTGVSGSGKSTLVNDILAAAAARKLNGAKTLPGRHRGLEGLEHFEKTVLVDQEPIGRSPRSNPATYTKLLDLLRDLFAQVPAGQGARLQGEPVQLQRPRRPLRALPGRRPDPARHAVPGRRLHRVPELRRPALQPGDAGGALPRPEHRRRARPDRARGHGAVPEHPAHHGKTGDARRRRARLSASSASRR